MREHPEIMAVIASGDAAHARNVVHAHIDGYHAETNLATRDGS